MDSKVEAKYIRVSPRKVKLIADAVRRLPLDRAIAELRLTNKAGARPLLDALMSARANGVNNLKLNVDTLVIKSIEVNGGPVLKRWQPVSRGMSHGYKKRMSHINVVLTDVVKEMMKEPPKKDGTEKKAIRSNTKKEEKNGSKNKS